MVIVITYHTDDRHHQSPPYAYRQHNRKNERSERQRNDRPGEKNKNLKNIRGIIPEILRKTIASTGTPSERSPSTLTAAAAPPSQLNTKNTGCLSLPQ